MPEYFDAHSHIEHKRFDDDRDEVLSRMKEKNVWTVSVGTDEKESRKAFELAQKHEGVFASIGLHPADNKKESFDESYYKGMIADENVVMVGECGLDYFHEKEVGEQKRQRKEFEKQIEFAVKYEKPLMLHIRDAHKDALDILFSKKKEYGDRLRGNAHFFTEEVNIARKYYELNFMTSFPGVVTFTNQYDDTVRYAPKDLILSETDSPYAAPAPYRGGRSEPTYVIHVVERIAELRGDNLEILKVQLVRNAFRLIGIESKVA